MLDNSKKNTTKYILAIHSTNNHFGFACKEINNNNSNEDFFIRKFNRDLSNNLIFDLAEFLSERSFKCIERISVSIGPANFNATRLIVVLARTISQQVKCPLDYYSSFRIMAKRIAITNDIYKKNKSFWILNSLKNKGYIAGKYMISLDPHENVELTIKELIKPKLYKDIENIKIYFSGDYDTKDDLKELLNLSLENHNNSTFKSWKDVLPIYPISPVN